MKKVWKYLYFIGCGIYLIFQPFHLAHSTEKNSTAVSSSSANVGKLNFAIVDHDFIMQKADASQQARLEIDKKRNDFQEEINKYEQNLREHEQKLIDSQQVLTEIEYAKKQQEYEQEYSDTQQKVAQRRRQLEESFNVAREKIVDAILKIVVEIAHERTLQLVLPRSIIFFAEDTGDITGEVLHRLNKILPRVSFEYEHVNEKIKND